MGLEAVASLVIATLDLQAVRLLRDAIRTTELSDNARPLDPAGVPVDGPPPPLRHLHPEPVVEPRRHIHPPPVVEPRRVIHLAPELVPSDSVTCAPCAPAECIEPFAKSPIEPPWKMLPWDPRAAAGRLAPPPAKVVKRVIRPPDIVHKGTLIDFFI